MYALIAVGPLLAAGWLCEAGVMLIEEEEVGWSRNRVSSLSHATLTTNDIQGAHLGREVSGVLIIVFNSHSVWNTVRPYSVVGSAGYKPLPPPPPPPLPVKAATLSVIFVLMLSGRMEELYPPPRENLFKVQMSSDQSAHHNVSGEVIYRQSFLAANLATELSRSTARNSV